jgi:cell division protein ZipA
MQMDESTATQSDDPAKPGYIDIGLFKAELPNGGARVRPNIEPDETEQKTALNLDLDVPVLMNPIEPGDVYSPEPVNSPEPDVVNLDAGIWNESEVDVLLEPTRVEHQAKQQTKTNTATTSGSPAASASELSEMFVVVHVLAISEFFKGQTLLETLVGQNMSFGEMGIFHRLDANGISVFSLLNAVEPGTFDLNTIKELETPGVSLFLRVHELVEPLEAFNEMISVAQALADQMRGELKDVTRSDMTSQTVEHYRLEIQQFHRKV